MKSDFDGNFSFFILRFSLFLCPSPYIDFDPDDKFFYTDIKGLIEDMMQMFHAWAGFLLREEMKD
ncbi:MAG: hypothetical protein NTY07_09445 [Bacteroidia bacterium]|nr:hypothetical protein [Bacteroidia bacterium]